MASAPFPLMAQEDPAQFNFPEDVVVNGLHVYVADTGNHRVRHVRADSGWASTLAGTGVKVAHGPSPRVASRQKHIIKYVLQELNGRLYLPMSLQ
eukprot:4437694-Pyramimonas_sp.AAC.2